MGNHSRRGDDNRPKASPEQMGKDFDRHHSYYVAKHQAKSEGGEAYDDGSPADGSGSGGSGCALWPALFLTGLAAAGAFEAAHRVIA